MPKAPSLITFLLEKFLVAVTMVARSMGSTAIALRGSVVSIPTESLLWTTIPSCTNLLLMFIQIMKATERKMTTTAAQAIHMTAITATLIFLIFMSSTKWDCEKMKIGRHFCETDNYLAMFKILDNGYQATICNCINRQKMVALYGVTILLGTYDAFLTLRKFITENT